MMKAAAQPQCCNRRQCVLTLSKRTKPFRHLLQRTGTHVFAVGPGPSSGTPKAMLYGSSQFLDRLAVVFKGGVGTAPFPQIIYKE